MQLKSVKIGNLHTENNIFCAPLAGYTNAVFRQLCLNLGAGLTFTEMTSAKGLCYGSEKTRDFLKVTKEYGGIKACQLFGSDPTFFRKAAESEDLAPFSLIDINMGCPMPKIVNNGEGSALMENFSLASKIISEVKKSGKAVSVKFRIGIKGDKIISADFAKLCEDSGADMICVHGRTRDKIYAGEVNFDAIAAAKSAVKIPVIANGGVFSKEDAKKLMENTGADGVEVARGAMYSPWIFSVLTEKPLPDKKKMCLWQIDETAKYYGERFACVYMRKMIAFYLKGSRGAAEARVKLFKASSTSEIKEILKES